MEVINDLETSTMKYIKTAFLLLWILMLTSIAAYSQDNRTLDTKIADLLVQIPADNQQLLNRQMNMLLKLEEEGLRLPMPLCPRVSKSVVASMLEREPHTIPKYHWDISQNVFYSYLHTNHIMFF